MAPPTTPNKGKGRASDLANARADLEKDQTWEPSDEAPLQVHQDWVETMTLHIAHLAAAGGSEEEVAQLADDIFAAHREQLSHMFGDWPSWASPIMSDAHARAVAAEVARQADEEEERRQARIAELRSRHTKPVEEEVVVAPEAPVVADPPSLTITLPPTASVSTTQDSGSSKNKRKREGATPKGEPEAKKAKKPADIGHAIAVVDDKEKMCDRCVQLKQPSCTVLSKGKRCAKCSVNQKKCEKHGEQFGTWYRRLYGAGAGPVAAPTETGASTPERESPAHSPSPEPMDVLEPSETATVVPEETATVVPEETATVVPEETATVATEETTTVATEETTAVVPEETATVATPTPAEEVNTFLNVEAHPFRAPSDTTVVNDRATSVASMRGTPTSPGRFRAAAAGYIASHNESGPSGIPFALHEFGAEELQRMGVPREDRRPLRALIAELDFVRARIDVLEGTARDLEQRLRDRFARYFRGEANPEAVWQGPPASENGTAPATTRDRSVAPAQGNAPVVEKKTEKPPVRPQSGAAMEAGPSRLAGDRPRSVLYIGARRDDRGEGPSSRPLVHDVDGDEDGDNDSPAIEGTSTAAVAKKKKSKKGKGREGKDEKEKRAK